MRRNLTAKSFHIRIVFDKGKRQLLRILIERETFHRINFRRRLERLSAWLLHPVTNLEAAKLFNDIVDCLLAVSGRMVHTDTKILGNESGEFHYLAATCSRLSSMDFSLST